MSVMSGPSASHLSQVIIKAVSKTIVCQFNFSFLLKTIQSVFCTSGRPFTVFLLLSLKTDTNLISELLSVKSCCMEQSYSVLRLNSVYIPAEYFSAVLFFKFDF